jgi:hypothetical protein
LPKQVSLHKKKKELVQFGTHTVQQYLCNMSPQQVRVMRMSIFALLVSMFFWLWAIKNTIDENAYDDGLTCFTLTLVGSALGYGASQNIHLRNSVIPGRCVAVSFFATTTIFILACIFLDPSDTITMIYYVFSATLWAAYGIYYYIEVEKLRTESLDLSSPLISDERSAQF